MHRQGGQARPVHQVDDQQGRKEQPGEGAERLQRQGFTRGKAPPRINPLVPRVQKMEIRKIQSWALPVFLKFFHNKK